MVACCAHIVRLWSRWGTNNSNNSNTREANGSGDVLVRSQGEEVGEEMTDEQKERWSRSWKMASSRHYVRSWVHDGTLEGEHGWIDV
jgi:hypothetical protein